MFTVIRLRHLFPLLAVYAATQSYALDLDRGKVALEAGIYRAKQGTAQSIRIDGLIGDRYTIEDGHQNSGLLGLGYFFCVSENVYLGLNAYYLTKTTIKGTIIQEQMFENLSYRYDLMHFPIYASLKAHFPMSDDYAINFDLGIGPNIIKLHNFHDESIDGGITYPDDAFDNDTNVRASGMIGVGFEFSNLLYHQPVEIGYRFFYLGEGSFPGRTTHIQQLDTGSMYAHSLVLTVMFDV
jgi:hypothetical protein